MKREPMHQYVVYRNDRPCEMRENKTHRQRTYRFPNGFGASAVSTYFSYGGQEGLWEVAVMSGDDIRYDTVIGDDVVGFLNDDELGHILTRIYALEGES